MSRYGVSRSNTRAESGRRQKFVIDPEQLRCMNLCRGTPAHLIQRYTGFNPCQFILKLSLLKFRILLPRPGMMAYSKGEVPVMSARPQLAPQSIPEKQSSTTEQPSASSNTSVQDTSSESIAQLAYTLWQQRGCPTGSSETDWLEAEQQLRRQSSPTSTQSPSRTAVSAV